MPMLDIQRRHAEVFRLRIGDKDDRGNPRKLTDSIRVTSPNQRVIDAFVAAFGGETLPWEGQWQAYLPTNALPVMVLPGHSITQWWELYRGQVCERRCDGFTEQLSGSPCKCPADITDRVADKGACMPMTRINVVCPDVEVVGAGSLVTRGMVAAETLPQSVKIAEGALARGLMVPAVLRVVEHVGKSRRYIVPQLEIVGVSLSELTTGEVKAPREVVAAPRVVGGGEQRAIAPAPSPAVERPSKAAAKKSVSRSRPPLPGEAKAEDAEDGKRPNPYAKAIHVLAAKVAEQSGYDADPLCDAAVFEATGGKSTSANELSSFTKDIAVQFLCDVREGKLDLVAEVVDGAVTYKPSLPKGAA